MTPIYWGTYAPELETALKELDFTGHTRAIAESISKKLYSFATNAGWLGRTFSEIKKLCPNSDVKDGMNIVYTEDYRENKLVTPKEQIDNWMEKL